MTNAFRGHTGLGRVLRAAGHLGSAAVMVSLLLCGGVWGAALWHRLGGG